MPKSWMGSIESIELDWHEGVFVESLASAPALIQTVHGLMPDNRPVGVFYDAKCCLCDWAYSTATPVLSAEGLNVCIGHRTPDVQGVLHWVSLHKISKAHVRALSKFKEMKASKSAGQVGAAAVEETHV